VSQRERISSTAPFMNHSLVSWGVEEGEGEDCFAMMPIHFRSEEKGVSARRVWVWRMSSRWNLLRMSMSATSVAWPTSLLNSPMWALLQRFPEINLDSERDLTYSEDTFYGTFVGERGDHVARLFHVQDIILF